ncbi:GNAT family N-acetyltransferase [Maribacter halichondriae]|uniref:GNAT family N-acetyltransferase n=1 Tax=Maribacter halichondriae TaxID=2980554 RepID=UPI0023589758|nr:GNAT family N-acetyltransferase [Maribacter sp. Hal144]
MIDGIYITSDKSKLDIAFIHDYLSNQAYWAKGRSMELVKKSIENSLCFGVFTSDEKQIGFARIATDFVVFAWLMDAFIDEEYRGKGIGKYLIETIVNHHELINVNGIGLRTNDVHELYKQFGFEEIPNPETWMLRKKK